MLKTQKCVHEMMVALDLALPEEEKPNLDVNFPLLVSLVQEEAQEFNDAMLALEVCLNRPECWRDIAAGYASRADQDRLSAMDDDDFRLYWWAEVIDAICDTIVVLHNTSNAMGIDIEPFFDEVHRANMTKADGPVRKDGKRLKPAGFKPPRIMAMLKNLIAGGEAKP